MVGILRFLAATFVVGFTAAAPLESAPLTSAIAGSESTYESVGTFRSPPVSYNNSLILQRADPHIVKHSDGWYYFTASVPAYDQVILRRARTIQELQDAEEVVIFNRKPSGIGAGFIWAPELHYIDGKWYVYVAVGADDRWRIRPFVLEGTGENPLEAQWVEKGLIETNWDTFSLDATTFTANGVRYLVWAQNDPTWGDTNTALLIAPLVNPWTVKLPAVPITYPDLPWERIGHNVNEGAYVIKRNGTIFLTYSASATDHNYCMGLLTAPETADLMNPSSWTKSQEPVFQSNAETSEWGPGHNSFTVSEDGLNDVIVYHGRNYRDINGEPLYDPNRRTRVQKLYWRADGTPDFGIPIPDGPTPVRLRLAADENLYISHHNAEHATAAEDSPLASTQFRIVEPGFSGEGSISLESTDRPGQYLRQSGGFLVLSANDESTAFKDEASFEQVAGLANKEGVSFKAGDAFVKVGKGNELVVAAVDKNCDGSRATFFLE
ncbi:Alpha-L-arabinofuranosidase B [Paramyrothecium foliicola]|nr:Alpha-L-arabinofuranosidase B [Paramyrothecium foliicola]